MVVSYIVFRVLGFSFVCMYIYNSNFKVKRRSDSVIFYPSIRVPRFSNTQLGLKYDNN